MMVLTANTTLILKISKKKAAVKISQLVGYHVQNTENVESGEGDHQDCCFAGFKVQSSNTSRSDFETVYKKSFCQSTPTNPLLFVYEHSPQMSRQFCIPFLLHSTHLFYLFVHIGLEGRIQFHNRFKIS